MLFYLYFFHSGKNKDDQQLTLETDVSSERKVPATPPPAEQPCKIIVHQQNKIVPVESSSLNQVADMYPNYTNPSYTDVDNQDINNIPTSNGISTDVKDVKDEKEEEYSNNNSSNDTTTELDNLACSTTEEKLLNIEEDLANGAVIDVAMEQSNGSTQVVEATKQVNFLSNLSLKKSKSSSCSSLSNVIIKTSNNDNSYRHKDDIVPDQLKCKKENQLRCKDDIDDAEQLTSLLNNLAMAASGENLRDSKDFLIIFSDENKGSCEDNCSTYVAVEECVQCI